MARTDDVTEPGIDRSDGDADVAIKGYLDAMRDALIGPEPARAAILAEIGDGLLEAADTYRVQGLRPHEAALAAIAEFGKPHAVAAAFGRGLAARVARRTALGLLASGPLVGLAWITGAVFASLPPARYQLSGPWWALPVVGLMIIVGAPSMLLAVAATSRLGAAA